MKTIQVLSSARSLAGSGRLPEAERVLRAAIAAGPASPTMLQELASVLGRMERWRDAAELLAQAVRAKPDSALLHTELARALGAGGQLAPAAAAAERAVAMAPNDGQAWLELARRRRALGRLSDAALALQRAEALLPRDAEVKRLIASGLHALGRSSDAVEHARRAVALHKGPEELVVLGQVLLSTGSTEEALACFDQAIAAAPDLSEAILGKARAAEAIGDRQMAIDTLSRVVRGSACTNALLAQYASLMVRSPNRREVIDLCRSRLEHWGANPSSTIQLRIALGSLLEAEGDYAGAFESYREGKSLYPRTFNASEHTRRLREVADVFSTGAMSSFPRSSSTDPRPVFVVGMPRSGTTLLEQMIGEHPRAAGIGERDEAMVMIDALPRRLGVMGSYPSCFAAITQAALDGMASEYSAMVDRLAPDKDRVVDKMPHNFLGLGAIALMLPHATLVHNRRHPLDTCLSCFTTGLTFAHDYSTSLANLVVAYRAYRTLMDHWRSVLGDRLVEMEYEKLVSDPESEARRLLDAMGLPWDEGCLRFHTSTRAVTTASVSQVRRPLYDSSIGRWKRFEPFLGELIEGLHDYL